jgi:hypothetical protein
MPIKIFIKRKKTMNDINPTTGLPMSSGGIDVGGTPYGCSSDSFGDGASESGGGDFNNIANYRSCKVDAVLILAVIAVNVYIWR